MGDAMRMVSIPGSTSLQLLQQIAQRHAGQVAGAADLPGGASRGAAGPLPAGNAILQASYRTGQSLFDLSVPDPTAMKVRLMERLGEEFGFDMDDFSSREAYGRAIRKAVDDLKAAGGFSELKRIEKELGLDELGITLDTLVNAIVQPGGDADEAVDAALRSELGQDEQGRDIARMFQQDEIGRYGF